MASTSGKGFEEDLENSSKKLNIFCFRVRDVNPMALKGNFSVPRNKYDFLFYHDDYLFPAELKSTKAKSISFSEKIIKAYQIKSLTEAARYHGVIPGFIFNFRSVNETYFVPIQAFNTYKNIAENGLEHTYKAKVNKSSIPIGICDEIGIKLDQNLQRTRYFYRLDKLFDELISKCE